MTGGGPAYPCCSPQRGRWAGLSQYVVNLTDGRFSQTGRMHSCVHDVDAIFDEHLPAFVEENAGLYGGGPVPLVVWAHGGVVSETAGLTIAEHQVPWWIANGVYPLHFVWETGFLQTARQVFGRRARHRLNSDPALRAALRSDPSAGSAAPSMGAVTPEVERLPAGPVLDVPEYSGPLAARPWAALKASAAAASAPDGGARYVAERLARFCQQHRTASGEPMVSLHAVGHSAGAIFHADFLPMAKQVQVPGFGSLQLLAPAVRVDNFRSAILSLVDQDIRRVTVYTMNTAAENADSCFRFYRHSLLNLISRRFEPERNAPILGLEQSIRGDPMLVAAFGLNGARGVADIIFSPTGAGAPPDSRSMATSHGGFDEDPDTMDSVARRILGRPDIARFAAPGGPSTGDEELPRDPHVR